MAELDQVEELKRQLVDGLQVLTREGVLDGSGHLSARIPGADTLGDAQALFLRGHGIVVVGPSVASTCVIAARFEKACTDQLLLMSFSTPRPLVETSSGGGLSGPRMENPYRAWPFLLEKHGL